MSSFFHHLIQRHTDTRQSIMPRARSMFESVNAVNPIEHETENTEGNQHIEQDDKMKDQPHNFDPGTIKVDPTYVPEQPVSSKKESNPSLQTILHEKIIRVDSTPAVAQQELKEDKFHHQNLGPNTFDNSEAHDDDFENSGEKDIQKILAALRTLKPVSPDKQDHMQSGDVQVYHPHSEKQIQIEIPEKSLISPLKNNVPPTIKIHIGKIEIKAEKPQPVRSLKPIGTKPPISLDQYLQDRNKKA